MFFRMLKSDVLAFVALVGVLLLAFCAAWVVLFEASSRQAVHMGTDDRCVLGGPTPAPTPMLAAVTSPSGEAITSQPCG